MLNDLDFADDIALLEFTFPRAQVHLTSTAAAAKDLGLIINYQSHPTLQVYGESIHHVTDFRHLSSKMTSAASDFKRRKH